MREPCFLEFDPVHGIANRIDELYRQRVENVIMPSL